MVWEVSDQQTPLCIEEEKKNKLTKHWVSKSHHLSLITEHIRINSILWGHYLIL